MNPNHIDADEFDIHKNNNIAKVKNKAPFLPTTEFALSIGVQTQSNIMSRSSWTYTDSCRFIENLNIGRERVLRSSIFLV